MWPFCLNGHHNRITTCYRNHRICVTRFCLNFSSPTFPSRIHFQKTLSKSTQCIPPFFTCGVQHWFARVLDNFPNPIDISQFKCKKQYTPPPERLRVDITCTYSLQSRVATNRVGNHYSDFRSVSPCRGCCANILERCARVHFWSPHRETSDV